MCTTDMSNRNLNVCCELGTNSEKNSDKSLEKKKQNFLEMSKKVCDDFESKEEIV